MADMRLIDANALDFRFDVLCAGDCGCCECHDSNARGHGCKLISSAPTIDAVPVVHGRWILGVPIACSVCGKPAAEHDSPIAFWESPYCPWCGAKMDLKEE